MLRALAVLLFMAASASAGQIVKCPFIWPRQYAVDIAQSTTHPGLTNAIAGLINKTPPVMVHYHVDGYKLRTELIAPSGSPQPVAIYRVEDLVLYNLRPAQKIYYEVPLLPGAIKTFDPFTTSGAWQSEGLEIINGIECNKYEVHYVTPVNTMVKFFVWLTKDNTRPVRWMEPDRNRISMIDFTNFTPGPVDQKLFMPPDDYKKMPLPPRPNVITSVAPRPVLPGTPPPASVTPPETPKPAPPATTTNAPPLIAPAAIPVPAVKK